MSGTEACPKGPDGETVKELLERCDPDAVIPEPSENQVSSLVKRLDAIAPGLASDADETVENARNICVSILGEAQSLEQSTATRFEGDGVDELTAAQARKLNAVIAGEPWCK